MVVVRFLFAFLELRASCPSRDKQMYANADWLRKPPHRLSATCDHHQDCRRRRREKQQQQHWRCESQNCSSLSKMTNVQLTSNDSLSMTVLHVYIKQKFSCTCLFRRNVITTKNPCFLIGRNCLGNQSGSRDFVVITFSRNKQVQENLCYLRRTDVASSNKALPVIFYWSSINLVSISRWDSHVFFIL